MGLQLIFVVETNKKCKSDWIYIKETIERFFQYDQTQVKFTPVYMDGKGRYKNKEKEISSFISQYASVSRANSSRVLYCFDCDDYDIKREDSEFLAGIQQYCSEKRADFIWFCKDVESVYLGKKVGDSQKRNEAATFKAKKGITNVDVCRLSAKDYRVNSSNIINVLSKYLTRK